MRFILISMLFVCLNLSAQVTLQPNRNERAKDLYHALNRSKDSLKLQSKKMIKAVTFANNKFRQFHVVDTTRVALPITKLPKGRNTVIVAIGFKVIVLNILKE